jgi:protein-tyrosine phosphatase
MSNSKPTRVLFVCLGNICRSPTAEAVFRTLIEREGSADHIDVDSAGTGGWHVGEGPDPRMVEAGRRRGHQLGGRARQVEDADFERFDLILAMDASNLAELKRRAPDGATAEVRLFREFDPEAPGGDVPDPYYGGRSGFDDVVDIVERASAALLEHIRGRA